LIVFEESLLRNRYSLLLELGRTLVFLNVVARAEEVRQELTKVVGLVYIRGVNRVMPIEVEINHSKRLAI